MPYCPYKTHTIRIRVFFLFLEKRRKVFGGAIGLKRPVNTKEDDVVTKASAHVREKDAIARYAAGLIRDDDAVFIDAGTTTERMTEYIANKNAV